MMRNEMKSRQYRLATSGKPATECKKRAAGPPLLAPPQRGPHMQITQGWRVAFWVKPKGLLALLETSENKELAVCFESS